MFAIERAVLFFINVELNNPLLSKLMIAVSSHAFSLGLVFILLAFNYKDKNFLKFFLITVLIVGAGDYLNYNFLKPTFARLRPCHLEFLPIVVVDGCGGRFSFPSNHALNGMLSALLFSFYFVRLRWLFVSIAVLVGFSRVYLGVHHPLDIIGGFTLALIIALFIKHYLMGSDPIKYKWK